MANNPYVNKVEYGGNTVVDLTSDSATESDVAAGQSFHLASGAPATGTMPNLDTMTFGNLANPPSRGYTDGAFYEQLAEAINTKQSQSGGGGGALEILVTAPTGSTVTAEKDGNSYIGVENPSGTYTILVPEYGTYTVTATNGAETVAKSVAVVETTVDLNGTNYLRFSSPNSFTLATYGSAKTWDGSIYWRAGNKDWQIWDGSTILSSVNGTIDLRGVENTQITSSSDRKGSFVLTGSKISCIGNIESLLDYQTVESGGHPIMKEYCFHSLFYECTALISPPDLPATSLSNGCYSSMFYDCKSLETSPALPATILADKCYYAMFAYCKSLVTAPALPATTLTTSCYEYMFSNCTSLISPPAIPATTIAERSCEKMFASCTALTSIPNLYATALASHCYWSMFNGCTSLKVSETQTAEYQYVFRIPRVGTGEADSGITLSMLNNTGGTFTGTPNINTNYYTTNPPVG